MDKETIAEYKGLAAFVDKREREQASSTHPIKFKTKIKNFYDSHSLAEEQSHNNSSNAGSSNNSNSGDDHHDAAPPAETKIKAFTWPLAPKALKIKPKQHYCLETDPELSEVLESTVHQQASYYYPCYLSSLDLHAEDKIIQQTVRSSAHLMQLLLNVPIPAAPSTSKGLRRRPQRHLKASKKKTRKASSGAPSGRPDDSHPLLNWEDILVNAQTAGWPSAVIERARARLTACYRPS